MRIRCELCQREITMEYLSIDWELYAYALHLNLVHGYPEAFKLEADGKGRWSVKGKIVLVDADKFQVASIP